MPEREPATPVLRPENVLPGEARVFEAAAESLAGRRKGARALWPFLGPAFIASVAYVDPGNFATNIAAGSEHGFLLLWVVLAANLMAMVIQAMSSKLGIATGRNLPEVCRDRFPRRLTIGLWIQAELIAMATDLAEIVGAALGLHLLVGLPLFESGLLAGAATFGILALQRRGFRRLEATIAVFVGVIVAAFAVQVLWAEPSLSGIGKGFRPDFAGSDSVFLAAGILGATVMPHVIYLHSALTQSRVVGRTEDDRRRIARFERVDVVIAMSIAGLVNMCMLVLAAAAFYGGGYSGADDLVVAYDLLGDVLGPASAFLFAVALLASGLSSSTVGTMAGQVVMQGFVHRSIPILVRRVVTLAPALVILGLGIDPSRALVVSQVVLSFGIPFALVPLVLFTRDRSLMGTLVNRRSTTVVATAIAVFVVGLNVFLLGETLSGALG